MNVVPSDNNNKFTIYVNYDFINGDKCNKSSVRLLEPDVQLLRVCMNEDDVVYHANENNLNGTVVVNDDDNDEENSLNSNYSKSTSKMIQCQQISMYIGENKNKTSFF